MSQQGWGGEKIRLKVSFKLSFFVPFSGMPGTFRTNTKKLEGDQKALAPNEGVFKMITNLVTSNLPIIHMSVNNFEPYPKPKQKNLEVPWCEQELMIPLKFTTWILGIYQHVSTLFLNLCGSGEYSKVTTRLCNKKHWWPHDDLEGTQILDMDLFMIIWLKNRSKIDDA